MKYTDLTEVHRKYWNEMIDLGKEHNIEPWKLVRFIDYNDNIVTLTEHPSFTESTLRNNDIEFAITVIEGTPVFKGDKVYFRNDVSEFEILFSPVFYRAMIKRLSDGEEFDVPVCDLMLRPRYKNVPLSYEEMHVLGVLMNAGLCNTSYCDAFHNCLLILNDKIGKVKKKMETE